VLSDGSDKPTAEDSTDDPTVNNDPENVNEGIPASDPSSAPPNMKSGGIIDELDDGKAPDNTNKPSDGLQLVESLQARIQELEKENKDLRNENKKLKDRNSVLEDLNRRQNSFLTEPSSLDFQELFTNHPPESTF